MWTCDTRAAAEEATRIWQAEIDAGQMPGMMTGGFAERVMGAELAALRAEMERWRTKVDAFIEKRDPSATGHEGWEASRGALREGPPPWQSFAKEYAIAIVAKASGLSHSEVARRIIKRCEQKGQEHPKITTLRTFVSRLRRRGELGK
jgi:hypothetical protein